MKCLCLLAALMAFAGCTTLRPIQGTPAELQSRISSSGLLTRGDRVSIVTIDAKTHKFRVHAISEGIVQGSKDRVPVEQIVSVQRREFSAAKTFVLAGCGLAFAGLIIYAAAHAAPAFALGGGP
jgi:hypothetical protein